MRKTKLKKAAARRTLDKAWFFLKKLMNSEREGDMAQECYFEAAGIFARTTLAHLRNEFSRKPGFKSWLDLYEQQPLIRDLIDKRDVIIHDQKSIILSHEDAFYSDEAEKLSDQLKEIKNIIDECERLFK